jgi:hypothetical protein
MLKSKGLVTNLIAILGIIGLGWHIYVSKGLGVSDLILLMTSIGLFAAEDPKIFKKDKPSNISSRGIGNNSGDPEEEEEPPGRPTNG